MERKLVALSICHVSLFELPCSPNTKITMEITPLLPHHWNEVEQIYLAGIASGNATFETKSPGWDAWNEKHISSCRLVALEENKAIGWAALSPVSSRCVYAGVAEVSVYIHPEHHGKKIGQRLLEQLVIESEKENIWTLQAGIFPENMASISIHKKCGFREVGRREKLGKMDGRWRDVLLMERRSRVAGI
jgi:L-amino acid N-acyltransferase YncA